MPTQGWDPNLAGEASLNGKEVSVLLYWYIMKTYPMELSRNPLTKMPGKAVYEASC